MNLTEIFSSSVPLIWKQDSDNLVIAKFEIDEKYYECFIEAGTYTFDNKELSFLNVGFSRIIDGENKFDVTLDTQNSIKVIGSVINGVSRKIKEFEADAIMLSADDNVEKRMKIYQYIARNFSTIFGTWIKSIKTPNGEVTLLISSELDDNLVMNVKKFIESKNIEKR